MVYQDFIKCIEQQGSRDIKALNVNESCSTRQIPVEILQWSYLAYNLARLPFNLVFLLHVNGSSI
jgi:hypothetical protein